MTPALLDAAKRTEKIVGTTRSRALFAALFSTADASCTTLEDSSFTFQARPL
jgi:hypothetical protein